MTTYLLHGGKTSINNPNNDRFFDEFANLVDKPEVKILLCYWARTKDQWKTKSEQDISRIKKKTNKKIIFQLVENPTKLQIQLTENDVLYVAGGEAYLLEPYYKELGFLKEKLNNKIYAGSSMGTFLVSENYVLSLDDQDTNTIHQGVGLLPIQTLCHWNIETKKEQKLKLLKQNNKPILVLNETEYVKVHQFAYEDLIN